MRSALLRHYGPTRASTVISNGTDFPELSTIPPTSNKKDDGFIFAAGRIWDEAKNIEALAHIADLLPWPVHVAGDKSSPDGSDVRLDINCLGQLNENQMADWLKRASIFAAPAKYEPFGLAILEAARAGCALVLSDIPSLREIWGSAAVYVPTDQPNALRDALCDLIEEPAYLGRMASAAWHRAQSFTAERMAADHVERYHLLTARSVDAPAAAPANSASTVRSKTVRSKVRQASANPVMEA